MFVHGFAETHLDALCHLSAAEPELTWNGKGLDGYHMPTDHTGTIDFWRDGIVTRGVLYDIPRLRGTDVRRSRRSRCTGGSSPTRPPRRAWSRAPATRCSSAAATGPTSTTHERPTGLRLPRRGARLVRRVPRRHRGVDARVGHAGRADRRPGHPQPASASPVPLHVHHIVLPYMGMPILDNADFEPLAAACAGIGRWEFQFVVAPLVIPRATGSPVNPLAIL